MGLYITYTSNIRYRKSRIVFIINDAGCFIYKSKDKSNIEVARFEGDKLRIYAEIICFAQQNSFDSYEILLKDECDLNMLLTLLTDYLRDKDISVGLITLNKDLIENNKDIIASFGVTTPNKLHKKRQFNVRSKWKEDKKNLTTDYDNIRYCCMMEEPYPLPNESIKRKKPIRLEESFHDKFMRLLIESGKDNAEIYKSAGVTRQVFSKILCDKSMIPSKLTLVSLCIGLQLTLYDAKELMDSAGYSLSRSIMFDSIIISYLASEIYDLDIINSELNEYGCPLLGWHPRD